MSSNSIVWILGTKVRQCLVFTLARLAKSLGGPPPKMPHLPTHSSASSIHISSPAESAGMTIAKEAAMTFVTSAITPVGAGRSRLCGPLTVFLWENVWIVSPQLFLCFFSYEVQSLPAFKWFTVLAKVLCIDTKLFFKCFLFLPLFCQLLHNICPIVPLPYSQDAPNTCLASTEQFDLSPHVVIGGTWAANPRAVWLLAC